MGRYDLAEPVMEEALETRERVLGKTAPDTLMSLGNMAECHAALGRRDRAEALSLELIDRWEELQGDASPNTMVARKTLAGMYANWERYDEALELYEVAGSGLRAALGEDHSMTLDTLNNQAATLLMLEPSAEGDQSAVELALLVNRKTGFESPSYLDTLAVAYSRTGEFAKAVETERQALELLDEQRGPLRDELERNLIRFEAELRGTR
jgi:tetratricopeptide (TPR) repeat protein